MLFDEANLLEALLLSDLTDGRYPVKVAVCAFHSHFLRGCSGSWIVAGTDPHAVRWGFDCLGVEL